MKIFVISQPKSDFTGLTNICVDDSLQLNYTGGSPSTLPFAWTAESTTVVKKNNTQYAAKWSQAGDYLVRLQVGNSDCISDPDSIRVKVDPKMEPVTINCDPTLNSITFTWNDINCATDYELRINNTVISTNSNLSYTRNGLNEGDQVTITVTPQEDCACPAIPTTKTCEARACPPIVLALATPNREFCQGVISNTFQLTAQAQGSQSAGTGTWSGTGVNATGAFNPAGLNSGNYKVKYTYEETGCTFIDSLTITIHPNPTVSATAVDPDCFLENVGSAIVLPTGGTGTNYSLTVNNVASPSLALNGLAPGVYNVEITDSKGCKATNNFNIMNAIEAQLQINGNTLIKAGTQSTLALATTSLTDPLDSIVWTNSAGTVICSGPNCTEVTINPEADDTYCASIFYNDECTKEECIDIKVFKTTIITMPNIIRPGSATNGSFFVTNYENIQSVDEMLIFDRWGQKVFAIENVAPGATSGWDGTYNNQDVVPGVYVYMIELTLTDGSKDKLIGDVTVIGK